MAEHRISNPRVGFDKAAHTLPGIHQLLESGSHLATFNPYGPDLNGTITRSSLKHAGLKIKNHNCIGIRHSGALETPVIRCFHSIILILESIT
jgi:hypothetical protein